MGIMQEDADSIWHNIDIHKFAGKDILVTGGTGLIGSFILLMFDRLNRECEDKADIYVVVHNDIPPWLSFIEGDAFFHLIKGDLSNEMFLRNLPDVDCIIHAAGYGQPGKFMENKIKTIRLNTMTTDCLLSKVRGGGSFLFISTSEIYSGSENYPYSEDEPGRTTPQHSRACYIEGKRCGEAICMAYLDAGIDIKIARVSLAYGPCFKTDDRRVLNNFIDKALHGNIQMLDNGMSSRIYCYVTDTVEMLFNILTKGKDIVYNVGGIEETTIRGVADLIADYVGVEVIAPESNQGLRDAPKVVAMSVEKMKNEIKKTEFVPLRKGIARTIEWYKNEYGV